MVKNRLLSTLLIAFIFIATLSTVVTGTAFAQGGETRPVTDDEVNQIARQLYCPVCENIPLDVCGTQACAQWRDLIRKMLSEGKSEAEIKEYFVVQYGDRVVATPPVNTSNWLNWLFYIIPPIAILAGIFVLYKAFQSWRSTPAPSSPDLPQAEHPEDEYIARLEEELRRR